MAGGTSRARKCLGGSCPSSARRWFERPRRGAIDSLRISSRRQLAATLFAKDDRARSRTIGSIRIYTYARSSVPTAEFLPSIECRLTLTDTSSMYQRREAIHDRRSSRREVTVVACRSEDLAPTRAGRRMEVRTRVRASAWSTKGWSFGVPLAYFGSVLRTEGARGEAVACLLVAILVPGGYPIASYYARRRDHVPSHSDVVLSKEPEARVSPVFFSTYHRKCELGNLAKLSVSNSGMWDKSQSSWLPFLILHRESQFRSKIINRRILY